MDVGDGNGLSWFLEGYDDDKKGGRYRYFNVHLISKASFQKAAGK